MYYYVSSFQTIHIQTCSHKLQMNVMVQDILQYVQVLLANTKCSQYSSTGHIQQNPFNSCKVQDCVQQWIVRPDLLDINLGEICMHMLLDINLFLTCFHQKNHLLGSFSSSAEHFASSPQSLRAVEPLQTTK